MQEIVQARQILFVLCLVLGAEFQDDFESFLLKQTLTELSDGDLLLPLQLLKVLRFLILTRSQLVTLPLLNLEFSIDLLQLVILVDDLVYRLLLLLNMGL